MVICPVTLPAHLPVCTQGLHMHAYSLTHMRAGAIHDPIFTSCMHAGAARALSLTCICVHGHKCPNIHLPVCVRGPHVPVHSPVYMHAGARRGGPEVDVVDLAASRILAHLSRPPQSLSPSLSLSSQALHQSLHQSLHSTVHSTVRLCKAAGANQLGAKFAVLQAGALLVGV